MRKFRCLPKASMLRVKHLQCRFLNRGNHGKRNAPIAARKGLGLRNGALDHRGLLDYISMLFFVSVGDAQQHAAKARASITIIGRKVSAAVEGFAVRSEKSG